MVYGFYTSQTDWFLPARCSILQYVNELAKYACASFNGFFRGIGLSISEAKLELVLFARTHTNPPINVSLNGLFMPVMHNYRYLGVVFDGKLL
jgi:hypothetical protein